MTGTLARRIVTCSLVVTLAVSTGGCSKLAGLQGLSGSSTCTEFLNAPTSQQDQVVTSLAGKYQKPDFATPLGRPAIPYYCATHPKTTLDQFFAIAAG